MALLPFLLKQNKADQINDPLYLNLFTYDYFNVAA
jgi:hypothetical protein